MQAGMEDETGEVGGMRFLDNGESLSEGSEGWRRQGPTCQ